MSAFPILETQLDEQWRSDTYINQFLQTQQPLQYLELPSANPQDIADREVGLKVGVRIETSELVLMLVSKLVCSKAYWCSTWHSDMSWCKNRVVRDLVGAKAIVAKKLVKIRCKNCFVSELVWVKISCRKTLFVINVR